MLRHLVLFLLFLCLYLLRLFTLASPFPTSFQPGDQLSYSFVLLDYPTQLGSKFHYVLGHTTLEWDRYYSLSLGSRYVVRGTPQITKIGHIPASTTLIVADLSPLPTPRLNLGERVIIALSRLRIYLTTLLARALPEPESSLAAGILLGVKRDLSYDFRTSLIKSGTMHLVAASGYNVNVVATYLLNFCSQFLARPLALSLSGVGILFFCLLAGTSASVVRAGIMATFVLIGTGLGRPREAKHLFLLTVMLMLAIDPLYLFDVGWQLSVAATFGLLYIEPLLARKFLLPERFHQINPLLDEYFWPTIAASLATLPISFLTFGQVSLLGPLSNVLILPIVPLVMALTFLFLLLSLCFPFLSLWVAPFLYLPLHYIVFVIRFFGGS